MTSYSRLKFGSNQLSNQTYAHMGTGACGAHVYHRQTLLRPQALKTWHLLMLLAGGGDISGVQGSRSAESRQGSMLG